MVFLAGKLRNRQTYGCTPVFSMIFLAGKSPNIWLYTGVFYGIFGREIAKHMVVHRCFLWYFWQGNCQTYDCTQVFYMVFLARKSPNIWLYTGVFYGIFGREIANHMVVHGVKYTVLASPTHCSLHDLPLPCFIPDFSQVGMIATAKS